MSDSVIFYLTIIVYFTECLGIIYFSKESKRIQKRIYFSLMTLGPILFLLGHVAKSPELRAIATGIILIFLVGSPGLMAWLKVKGIHNSVN